MLFPSDREIFVEKIARFYGPKIEQPAMNPHISPTGTGALISETPRCPWFTLTLSPDESKGRLRIIDTYTVRCDRPVAHSRSYRVF